MAASQTRLDAIERVHRAIEDVRAGRIVILVDDEDRENEGDLVMAAEKTTPEAINFMARFGRGLICLALTEERVAKLEIAMMVDGDKGSRSTAFTVSIEAREGVTTGISAADRSHTVLAAVRDGAEPSDLVSPGHIFPLKARDGGVLRRTGHTEGSVDLAQLAGLKPAGVICEIMNEDGTMARMPDLVKFADEHGLRILSIADLIQFRLQHEKLVQVLSSATVKLSTGKEWTAHTFGAGDRQFLALALGELDEEPTPVRMHTGSVLGDVFGVRLRGHTVMSDVIARIEQLGKGVIVFIPPAAIDLDADLASRTGARVPRPRMEQGQVLREYGMGAQVLRELGLRQIRLLTNRPRRIAALEGYGLEIVEQMHVSDAEAMSVHSVEMDVAAIMGETQH